MKLFASLALVGAAGVGLGLSATAATGASHEPGSLLVYPMFDNVRGGFTVITVTNTNSDLQNGSVAVEYRYIDGTSCNEFNRTRNLTPNDTVSVLARNDNPNMQKGYLYVYAKHKITGKPIKFDHLAGEAMYVAANTGADFFVISPFVYKAGEALVEGDNTDLENGGVGDGIRDLNGLEYQTSPDEILIPHFFGQIPGPAAAQNNLVLINLTGGKTFEAIVDFLVYNDNEEVFSAQHKFKCWDYRPLLEISNVFAEAFLDTTNDNPLEEINTIESGWYKLDGNVAFSTNTSIPDPAILAVQVARGLPVGGVFGMGTLPFTLGSQDNGDLLPLTILGDVQ